MKQSKMGIFNNIDKYLTGGIFTVQGPPGPPGLGFTLTKDGNYDMKNKKLVNVRGGDAEDYVMVKSQIEGYVSNNTVKKSCDAMTGPLIVPKDSYPVQGDLNKVISYETQKEIFLPKNEGGQMSQPTDMGGFAIENLKTPIATDHAVNKDYVDKNFIAEKVGLMRGSLSMNKNDLIGLPDTPAFSYSAINRNYVTTQLKMKLEKAADIDMKNWKITALTVDPADTQSATNVGYVKNAVNIF